MRAYRDEVEKALVRGAGLWDDRTRELGLLELGVRLGLEAAAAIASSRVQAGRPSSEGTAPILGGADYHWVAQEIARLRPFDVLKREP